MIVETAAGFAEMALSPEMKASLEAIGYHNPSPIQAEFVPAALEGVDLMGQAKTGTGKTAAYLIPILERIDPAAKLQALILVPTRELVRQVQLEAERLIGDRPVRVAAIYGGTGYSTQVNALRGGAQIAVGSPGRVIDLLRQGHLKTDEIRFVVLDEADRMLDIGFRPDIERILQRVPDERNTYLLSATMPKEVLRLIDRYMRNPRRINLSTDEISVDRIEQRYLTVDRDRKFEALLRLLARERPRQCLVFCQTKDRVRWLASELGRRVRGVMAMRGDLPQNLRNRVMEGFRAGEIRILVATDVVGRGIDVQGISHVFNYDVPEDPESYVHRIGRTGRMGMNGVAITLVEPDQGYLLTDIEILINRQIRVESIQGFNAVLPGKRATDSEDPKRSRVIRNKFSARPARRRY